MGLRDDIKTLEARKQAGQPVGDTLAKAYAEQAARKASQRLFWGWFDNLADLLTELGRYDELVQAAGGVDPSSIGWADAQDAVIAWAEAH